MVKIPDWLKVIVREEKFKNILMRTTTEEADIFIVEQEVEDYTRMIADDPKLPYVLDVIIREVEDIYGISLPYEANLSRIAQIGFCGDSDIRKYCPFLEENDIKIYTLEYYLFLAYNMLIEEEDESSLVHTLYHSALGNPILDMIAEVKVKSDSDWPKLGVYNLYTYIVNTFLLTAVVKGKAAFPLAPEDFKRARVEDMYQTLCATDYTQTVPLPVIKYLDLQRDENSSEVMTAFETELNKPVKAFEEE